MVDSPRFAYVQPRLQARFALRPSRAEWRLMEASADVDHFIQAARQTSLRPWVDHLNADASAGHVERTFRDTWGERTNEASAWPGPAWAPAVTWLRWLPWLPAMRHLARGQPALPWMRDDPVPGAGSLSERPGHGRDPAPGSLRPLIVAEQTEDAWLAQWHRLLPESGPWVAALVDAVMAHRRHMASPDGEGAVLRQQLSDRMTRLFRRFAGGPGAFFAWLAIEGLDAERLRYGILSRSLVPRSTEALAWA
jgi:hypothetical protein